MLFISDLFSLNSPSWQGGVRGGLITITDPRIHHQCLHVLRMKAWETFFLQPTDWSVRYKAQITTLNKKEFTATIINEEKKSEIRHPQSVMCCIALPNRRDKAELIVQKLTEIGVSQIIFAPSDRSIIHIANEKKLDRLHSIALEACEQSYGRHLPDITIASSLIDYCHTHEGNYLLCDIPDSKEWKVQDMEFTIHHSPFTILIGPEWWRSDREREFFTTKNYHTLWLGSTVLRMETAAIVASRYVLNHCS